MIGFYQTQPSLLNQLPDRLRYLIISEVVQTPIAMPIPVPVVPSQIIYLITATRHA